MRTRDFIEKLAKLPEEAPEEIDHAMIASTQAQNDDTVIPLTVFKTLMDFPHPN